MIEPEDPESVDEENGGSDVDGAGVPWCLPGQAVEEVETEEEEIVLSQDEVKMSASEVELEALTIWCPDCGQELNILREHLGMQGVCLNCSLPIVASMRPDESGSMRVHARRVFLEEESSTEDESPAEVLELDLLEVSGENEEGGALLVSEEEDQELSESNEEEVIGDESVESPSEEESESPESNVSVWSVAGAVLGEGVDPLLTEGENYGDALGDASDDEGEADEESPLEGIPVPSWMKKSLQTEEDQESAAEEEGEAEEEDEFESEEGAGEQEGDEPDMETEESEGDAVGDAPDDEGEAGEESQPEEIPVPSWMKKDLQTEEDQESAAGEAEEEKLESEEETGEKEGDEPDMETEEDEESEGDKDAGADADADAGPSWAKGGNPWDALGLSEQKPGEDPEDPEDEDDEQESAENEGEDDGDDGDLEDEDDEDDEDEESLGSDGGEYDSDGEDAAERGEGDNEAADEDEEALLLEEQKESRLSLVIAAVIILVVGGGATALVLKPDLIGGKSSSKSKVIVEKQVKSADKNKADKLALAKSKEKLGSEKETKGSAEDSSKTKPSKAEKIKVAREEPKAVERPEGQDAKKVSLVDGKKDAEVEPKPEMATARAEIHDDVALRMHQEGERAIRRFYKAGSIEERSAFVLEPDGAVQSMRAFYKKPDQLPTLRYVEFKGKVSDPTSGFRFGVFDVHEKENEESHRWCVVEIEPGQYALDWGLYEQLEASTLIAYLAKSQASAKKFRFLMKLGDTISAIDSPWDEEAVKVYLQLPLASSGGEAILLKKSAAEKLGILGELGNGKMKIGQVELEWVSGDKDPGSKVPTITKLEGWGAWSKIKMRGLN